MKIYLDNCCFNRPFDDPSQLRIRLEAEAKLKIQEEIRAGQYRLIWSYILDYENHRNPVRERKEQVALWRTHAWLDVPESQEILVIARSMHALGFKKLDSLHIACAIGGEADFFLTTDDGILKKTSLTKKLIITDPIRFVKEMDHAH